MAKTKKVDGEPIAKSGIEKARKAIQILESVSLFSQLREAMLNFLKKINHGVDKEKLCNTKQSIILTFFKKINLST